MSESSKAVIIIKKAQDDFTAGKISRRDFNSIMMTFGAIAGYTLFTSFASAWTGSRMRKSTGVSIYQIPRSLRFRSNASAYLTRTPSSAGDRKTFTWSSWIKRGKISLQNILQAGTSPGGTVLYWGSDDCLHLTLNITAAETFITNQVFRDPAAWYHLVLAVDTTQATSSNRVKIYINGTQITSFSTLNYPAQNTSVTINSTVAHTFGLSTSEVTGYLDGHQSEIYFIDGLGLAANAFGEFNSITGAWTPKKYSGAYGTNGFYLPLTDISSTTNLVKDSSGNNNHWTPNNISLTAGVTYDSMTDVPLSYGTTDRGNYCTLNPLSFDAPVTISAANLSSNTTAFPNWSGVTGTISVSSGKWYWETIAVSAVNPGTEDITAGIQLVNTPLPVSAGGYAIGSYAYISSGSKISNSSTTAYGATWTNGDVIGVALDLTAGTLTFYKNGVSQGIAFSSLSGTFTPAVHHSSYPVAASNFGQRPFSYSQPTGFKSLHTGNLPTPTIEKANQYFDVKTYVGDETNNRTLTLSFDPDLTWFKQRTGTAHNMINDRVRGNDKALITNLTNTQSAFTGYFSFGTIGSKQVNISYYNVSGGNEYGYNQNTYNYVAWMWKASGATVTNNSGTVTSQVSANPSSGFSIVTYTGNLSSSGTFTVGHGLNSSPSMVITKSTNATSDWNVMHKSLPNWDKVVFINSTTSYTDQSAYGARVAPTSTVFTASYVTGMGVNGHNHIAYCFAEVDGFSKFGSYTGNGSLEGPFIHCGFQSKWIMIKRTDSSSNWQTYDTARETSNKMFNELIPNSSEFENSYNLNLSDTIDITSIGFKFRNTGAGCELNVSGATYIFAAFAETPFKYATAR